jgi:hypothetical protein
MAHISIGNEEFKGISFLQNKSVNTRIVAMCKTLDPCWLYLHSTSSFHQVFMEEHLDNSGLLVPPYAPTAMQAPILLPRTAGTAT